MVWSDKISKLAEVKWGMRQLCKAHPHNCVRASTQYMHAPTHAHTHKHAIMHASTHAHIHMHTCTHANRQAEQNTHKKQLPIPQIISVTFLLSTAEIDKQIHSHVHGLTN